MIKDLVFALVVSAGTGERMQQKTAKQFILVDDKPIIVHTLENFARVATLEKTVVVVAPEDTLFETLLGHYQLPQIQIAKVGGKRRQDTVLQGLHWLKTHFTIADSDWVLVHDGIRFLLTSQDLHNFIEDCYSTEVGGLLAMPVVDTLKRAPDLRVEKTLPRTALWLAQTPQMFRFGALFEALSTSSIELTDESSALEYLGFAPKIFLGKPYNIKVTYPEDLALAKLWYKTLKESTL